MEVSFHASLLSANGPAAAAGRPVVRAAADQPNRPVM